MLNSLVSKFCTHVQNLMMSHITGDVVPQIEVYDDVAVLSYSLPTPLSMDQLMDYMEDDMELKLLYLTTKSDGKGKIQHVCEIDNPAGRLMYKVNAISNTDGIVSEITVTIFSSLELMSNDLISDLNNHTENGFEIEDLMDDGEYVASFCL